MFAIQDAATILSPATVGIVTAIAGLLVALISSLVLNWERARGVIGALLTAYGTIAPFISSFPPKVGAVLAALGIVLTITAERIQGGKSAVEK